MEEFLGVLFCGGRGTRIKNLTGFISKSFIPVYDTPVFRFGLKLLEKSKRINEIVILTNERNDAELRKLGYQTIIQDDSKVSDMHSGWEYIKNVSGTKKNGVLVPSDNICRTNIDKLISVFQKKNKDFLFLVHKMKDRKKLSQMGCYDFKNKRYQYKSKSPLSDYGVIAPYILRNKPQIKFTDKIFESKNSEIIIHEGYWFDTGDYESILKASKWRKKKIKK